MVRGSIRVRSWEALLRCRTHRNAPCEKNRAIPRWWEYDGPCPLRSSIPNAILQSLFAQPESLVSLMDSVANSKGILNHSPVRSESRVSLQVRVDLRSVDIRTPSQDGLTDNVSARGARVLTNSRWNPDDRLNLISLLGSLKSRARVIYCEPMGDGLFAIGLRLYATAGTWKLPA